MRSGATIRLFMSPRRSVPPAIAVVSGPMSFSASPSARGRASEKGFNAPSP
jgi:hypothetical protein